MATIIKMMFYPIFIGALVINVMSIYNPMLTYTLRFKRLEVHPNFTVESYTIDRYKEGEFINGQITINSKKQIDKAVVVFYRCDQDGINCEYFQMWTLTGLCTKLKEKNQIWSRWYNSFDPPMVCPLDKGTYRIKNATVDIGPALLLYPQVTDYQWRVVQKFYSDDIFIGSYMMELYLFGYRKKMKSIL
ncbi:uncharacterized protein LOC132940084 [Metopolophium dirhodum]|uniref:uncharacterized protein LOC132940084 n=1 Tax=Metopolophium dirhodum TaxID=44670 RepID=UPI0029900420|nr:uncharacterized protein LOC132940084 [Metopolophium dirhodum]